MNRTKRTIQREEDISNEWVFTLAGVPFFPRDPDSGIIDPRHLATTLSRICRFGGRTIKFYSVAQHSFLCSELVLDSPLEIQLATMLHDADEAFSGFGDLEAPLRHHAVIYEREVKPAIDQAVARRFQFSERAFLDRRVDWADQVLRATEIRDVVPPGPWPIDWDKLEKPLEKKIEPWSMEMAEQVYLAKLTNLLKRWERVLSVRYQ